MEICFTPGEITPDPVVRAMIGEGVELVIKNRYCSDKGGCDEFLKVNSRQTDFFDVTMGFSRCRHLASYLKMHNPHVDPVAIASECESKKQELFKFPVPDIISHEPAARREFYEIKPDSPSGRDDADKKIDWFLAISDPHIFDLPYKAGTMFSPQGELLLFDATWFGVPAKVRLRYSRDKPGRLLYKFCVEASLSLIPEVLWKHLIKLVIVAFIVIIIRRPRDTPSPSPSPVPELPLPVPIPIPIPRVPIPQFFDVIDLLGSPLVQSVGSAGVNDFNDVTYVQLMLGHWLTRRSGSAPIAVDGQVGSETIGAIEAFQSAVTGQVDGRIDPLGPAIAELERDHWRACLEVVPLDVDIPLEGEVTTEDTEDGPQEAVDPIGAIAHGIQDYYDVTYQDSATIPG